MRSTILAVAGAAAVLSAALAGPAAAQARYASAPFGSGVPYNDPNDMQYLGDDGQIAQAPIPRQRVEFDTKYAPGTIVISTSERRLYFVDAPGEAIEYGVGVGRPGFAWSGIQRVSAKKEWPSWTPPAAMLKRRPDLPRYMSGGIDNPLGARAMYLGSSEYRIHGSNEPDTIGQAVSSGCIRMTNEDVEDLYERVKVGARVVVLD
jgi:lipoprotein-anchoring transpeptidase ErfK/SrfK